MFTIEEENTLKRALIFSYCSSSQAFIVNDYVHSVRNITNNTLTKPTNNTNNIKNNLPILSRSKHTGLDHSEHLVGSEFEIHFIIIKTCIKVYPFVSNYFLRCGQPSLTNQNMSVFLKIPESFASKSELFLSILKIT